MISAWVVIPTYDEAENLVPLVRGVRAALPDARVLVVDDASPDGTGEVADDLARRDPAVAVLHRPGKAGLGRAYAAGFAHVLAAGAGVVLQMDADGSHDPADLPRLVAAIEAGADVAVGSRYVPGGTTPGWSLARRLLSRGGNAYARLVLGLPVHDLTGGFKAFRAAALRAVDPDSAGAAGYVFQVELTDRALRLGLEVAEVPIAFAERRAGRSKMSPAIAREAVWRIPALRAGRRPAPRPYRPPRRPAPVG